MKRAIYACDVGSTRAGNFGWVRVEPDTPKEIKGCSDICALVTKIKEDLEHGYSIALGFEAPLFIPVPQSADDLSRGRQGEGNRPFSAQAGAYVTTLSMHQAAWVLREIYCSCGGTCTFMLNPQDWSPNKSRPILFCWEAFVAGSSKGEGGKQSHIQDAATAAMAFLRREEDLINSNAVTVEHPFSLIGAAALWSGWSTDLKILHHDQTLVIKPSKPYEESIDSIG
ncbi:hypothetical protein BH24ACT22_BH24ACT22_06730 [soil metagenome]